MRKPAGKTTRRLPGVRIGHASDFHGITGCTVILLPEGSRGAVDIRGGAPGTRAADSLYPERMVERLDAVVLTGGSAFGLACLDGVMRFLEEKGVGFDTGHAKVPIVAGAVLYDLNLGSAGARPDAEMGYQACMDAGPLPGPQGNVGAGTGASVGKLLGIKRAMKGGLGVAIEKVGSRGTLAAVFAVNPAGSVVDRKTGQVFAGPRHPRTGRPLDTAAAMRRGRSQVRFRPGTTIGAVITDVRLDKPDLVRVAIMAHDGLSLAVSPAHMSTDGDVIFAVSVGNARAPVDLVGVVAAGAVERAIHSAVRHARTIPPALALRDLEENAP